MVPHYPWFEDKLQVIEPEAAEAVHLHGDPLDADALQRSSPLSGIPISLMKP